MIKVNEKAPVIARGEIEISADPEIIWDVIADIEKWPSWNPEVKSVLLKGKLVEGLKFKWKAGPGTITSTIQMVDQPKILAWTGKTMGIKAVHIWRLEPKNDKTIVRTEESWEGLIVRILRGRMQQMLQRSIESGLEYLNAEAKRRLV